MVSGNTITAAHKLVNRDANVFQELIQNAEDAHASQVKFLHDKHSYRREKLHSPELARFQVCCVIY